jgi:TolB-like protein
MADFFAKLKRRHIYRVGAAYVVVAWALTQLVEILAQVFTLPLWIAQTAIVLLALGFPVALLVAWTIESKPHEAVAATIRSKNTAVDWALFGAVAVLIALTGYQQIAGGSGDRVTGVEPPPQAAPSSDGISLAVLPFANLSGDSNQEFFSDGITGEITSALARVPELRVVARTSAFEFKGQNRDIQVIGQQLRATHLIEGSVRRAGDRVRVTAQLINAGNGTHIWSENYDRQLNDMFAIQEDIARAIATSLRMPLSLGSGENLVANRSIDSQSYELYLRAKGLWESRGSTNLADARRLLEQVVASNPGYAPAWALLCGTYFLQTTPLLNDSRGTIEELRRSVGDLLQKADTACRKALATDSNLSLAYATSATMAWSRGNPLEGEELYKKALALDPNDSNALQGYALRLAVAGRIQDALAMSLKAHELEPFLPQQADDAARLLWLNGRNQEAIALANGLRPAERGFTLATIFASMGRYGEAADALKEQGTGDLLPEAIRLLRMAPTQVDAPESLPAFPTTLNFVFVHTGAPDRVLDDLERRADAGYVSGGVNFIWHPSYAPVRRTERFKVFMRKTGYIDYWRARGWPDLCRPMGTDDFVCD